MEKHLGRAGAALFVTMLLCRYKAMATERKNYCSMSMHPACSLEVSRMLSEVEGGGQPYPVFFAGANCNNPTDGPNLSRSTSRYPKQGETMPFGVYDRRVFCQRSGSNGANPLEYTEDECNVPAIRTMLVPEMLEVQFDARCDELVWNGVPSRGSATASSNVRCTDRVHDPGRWVSTTGSNASTGNIVYTFDRKFQSPYKWGSSRLQPVQGNSTQVSAGKEPFATADCDGHGFQTEVYLDEPKRDVPYNGYNRKTGENIDSWKRAMNTGKMLRSAVSCGQFLWPSFAGVSMQYDINNGTKRAYKRCAVNRTDSYSFCTSVGDKPGVLDESRSGERRWTPGAWSIRQVQSVNKTLNDRYVRHPDVEAVFTCSGHYSSTDVRFATYCDCASNYFEAMIAKAQRGVTEVHQIYENSDRKTIAQRTNLCSCPYDSGNKCGCQQPIDGTVQRVHVRPNIKVMGGPAKWGDGTKTTWRDVQVFFCRTGGMRIAGVPIQRYTPGSPACDEIMLEACTTTSNLNSDEDLRKSCHCILEQQRLKRTYAGVDLPVACFSSVCNTNDTGVYKTASMNQGCTAKLCRQVLTVSGAAIVQNGTQVMKCHMETYNVQDYASSGTGNGKVPFVNTEGKEKKPGLDEGEPAEVYELWATVGVVLAVIVLVAFYLIRRWRSNQSPSTPVAPATQAPQVQTVA